MAAFCHLKPPRVNILPSAKYITPQTDKRGLIIVCYKRSITLQVLHETSIIISHNMTKQNQKLISVSVLDTDQNPLYFVFGREAQKFERNVKSIVALVFLWCFRLLNGFLKSSWHPLITLHLMCNCLNCLIWSKSDYCTVI